MKRLVLALLLAALASPALAQSFSFSSFLLELEQIDIWDDAVEISPEPGFFDTVELAGGFKVALDRTDLSQLSEMFGNGIQTYLYLGYTTSWLCYTHAGRRVWYIVDLTYETTEEVDVGSIIDEPADPATDSLFHCNEEPRAMLAVPPSLPGIGATRQDLEARFGLAIPPDAVLISGMADSASEGSGVYDMKIVTYRLTDGVVDALQIAEDYVNEDAAD